MLIEWTIVGVMAKDNINEVAYNTKTAEAIAKNGSGREIMHSDERWFNETLYRKKSGEFFLYGSGGVFTKYAKQTGPNSWERSEAILPLTEDEAKQWAMNNLGDESILLVRIHLSHRLTWHRRLVCRGALLSLLWTL